DARAVLGAAARAASAAGPTTRASAENESLTRARGAWVPPSSVARLRASACSGFTSWGPACWPARVLRLTPSLWVSGRGRDGRGRGSTLIDMRFGSTWKMSGFRIPEVRLGRDGTPHGAPRSLRPDLSDTTG